MIQSGTGTPKAHDFMLVVQWAHRNDQHHMDREWRGSDPGLIPG